MNHCSSDLSLKNIMPTINIMTNTSKEWHKYVTSFLNLHIQTYSTKVYSLPLYLMKILQHANSFNFIKDRIFSNVKPFRQNLTWPSGRIILNDFPNARIFPSYRAFLQMYHYSNFTQKYYFDFFLSPIFQLNISLSELYFNAKGCHNHLLSIIAIGKNKSNSKDYSYCGQYPQLNVYPVYTHIVIHVTAFLGIRCWVTSSFSVIDVNILYSIPVDPGSFRLGVLSLKSQYEIFMYYFKALKLQQVFLILPNVSFFTYIIYDGPDAYSEILSKKAFVKTSTFQCTLHGHIEKSTQGDLHLDVKYVYHSEIKHIKIVNNTFFRIPNSKCKKNLCLFSINTTISYTVLITVKSIIGFQDHGCIRHGLLVADGSWESPTLCSFQLSSRNRQFYSTKSSTNLVMFWYSIYGKFSASVLLSNTNCKVVRINPCDYRILTDYCPQQMGSPITASVKYMCTGLLNTLDVFKYKSLDITYRKGQSTLLFSLIKQECFIFQFSGEHPRHHLVTHVTDGCSVNMAPKTGKETIIGINGVLQWNAYIDNNAVFINRFEFCSSKQNASDTFSCPKDMHGKPSALLSLDQWPKTNRDELENTISYQNSDIKEIFLVLVPADNAWIDVKVVKSKKRLLQQQRTFGDAFSLSEKLYIGPTVMGPASFNHSVVSLRITGHLQQALNNITLDLYICSNYKDGHTKLISISNSRGRGFNFMPNIFESKRFPWNYHYTSK